MKRMVAALLSVVLALATVCPAFALSSDDPLNLVVLGDSISRGAGLNEGEVPYGKLVADLKEGTYLNLAQDGYECEDVLRSIKTYKSLLKQSNCYALSVGSNDYLEYLAQYVLEICAPDKNFAVSDLYNDLTDFFTDILLTHETNMYAGIQKFMSGDAAVRENWIDVFCDKATADLKEIIAALEDCNPEAPVLLLTYYSPGDVFGSMAEKAAVLLQAASRNIDEAVEIFSHIDETQGHQRAAQLIRGRIKLLMLRAEIYSFTPLLKEFGIDVTKLNPLWALAGMGIVGYETYSQDRTISTMLGTLAETVEAVSELIQFTSQLMEQLNGDLLEISAENDRVVIVDVSTLGQTAENISTNDHFHPSETGHQVIADQMVEALENYLSDDPIPEPEDNSPQVFVAMFFSWLFGLLA